MFRSFVQAGFECSTHKIRNGKRLDLIRSTQHDRFAREDYRRLRDFGIHTARIGARWHLIEDSPGIYNFESLAVLLDAANAIGIEVLLDLMHFGWPEHVQVLEPSFVSSFGRFTHALARFLKRRRDLCRIFAPMNEISFLSWAGGDVAALNPHTRGRGNELKRNLVRAAILASDILLNELNDVRLFWPEPVIHIVGNPAIIGDEIEAEKHRLAQFEAWDMLCGRLAPELGGKPEYLDVLGLNFYDRNQWLNNSTILHRGNPSYRPFHQIIEEIWRRYRRPMFVSETGTEDCRRAEWFNYICEEVLTAHSANIPVHGICLYPILNHPGWDDDRHCHNGLFDYADESGNREIYWPLAQSLLNNHEKLARSNQFTNDSTRYRPDLFFTPTVGLRLPASSTSDEPLRAHQESFLS
ncbi:MAG: beta-glucosidase [Acidobacteriaceae bacterium]|nr:beta-glucosidase [Acidobacteriaceae bacterium]